MPKGFGVAPYEIMFFLVMRDGPAYGYELAARFNKMTRGHIRMSYGTIYPFLRRMERRGVIRSRKDESSGRVYYELTRQGKEAQEKLSKRIKESQKAWEEKLLGIWAIHEEVFGRKALTKLLKRT
ncbi:MAG: PadR family transcriptional regulator [Candidatus Bathyarchaeota archaeon]|nr:PadR family transcriptional regulator [Candidatus Bathyarchaeota archaeon]